MTLDQAKEAIYTSLDNDNDEIDLHINALKQAMMKESAKDAVFQSQRLPINNREGRKTMQAYFKKRGVKIRFED